MTTESPSITNNSVVPSGLLDLFSLSGQTAIVTGCSRGIGSSMAIGLAKAGATVLLIQRDTSNTATLKSIESLGGTAKIYQADVSDKKSLSELLPSILKDGYSPSILVTAAGITHRHVAEEFPDEDWDDVINTNLSSCFKLARDFAKYLISLPSSPAPPCQKRGSIIFLASLMTYQGGLKVPAYAATKGAIGSLTKALSNEWASQGINVNAVAPGYVRTDMTENLFQDKDREPQISCRIPIGRWGKTEDFEGVTIFLASKASSFVSGEILLVDGGWMGR